MIEWSDEFRKRCAQEGIPVIEIPAIEVTLEDISGLPRKMSTEESASFQAQVVMDTLHRSSIEDNELGIRGCSNEELVRFFEHAKTLFISGWSCADVLSLFRCFEEINPDLDEDVALRRMEQLNKKYRGACKDQVLMV